jgi:hypothetical protein
MEESMKLKIALAIALVSTVSPVLAQPNQHQENSHLHATPGLHDRSPRPHTHQSQPHH